MLGVGRVLAGKGGGRKVYILYRGLEIYMCTEISSGLKWETKISLVLRHHFGV